MLTCRCAQIRRLDGHEAQHYAAEHLKLTERGREPTGAEDYQCDQTRTAWVLDFPLRWWAGDRHGSPRLRKLPLPEGDPPIGALDWPGEGGDPMPPITLEPADAAELAETLQLLSDWLACDPARLGLSLQDFIGHPGYGTAQLRQDLNRFVFLLGGSDGESLFGP